MEDTRKKAKTKWSRAKKAVRDAFGFSKDKLATPVLDDVGMSRSTWQPPFIDAAAAKARVENIIESKKAGENISLGGTDLLEIGHE
eukprot:3081505-Rhodomonas_salina.1